MTKKLSEEIKRIKHLLSTSPMSEEMEKKIKDKLDKLKKELREKESGNRELNLND